MTRDRISEQRESRNVATPGEMFLYLPIRSVGWETNDQYGTQAKTANAETEEKRPTHDNMNRAQQHTYRDSI